MSEWKKTTIGEEAEVFVGFPFRSEAFAKRGVRLLRGDNIGQGRLDWSDAECLPDEIASDHVDYHLRAGDTVLAMDRPWVSAGLKYARVTEHDTPSLLVQRTARLRSVGEANADFLHYVIAGQTYEKYIRFITTGSLVPHISKEQIQAFPFSLPPIAVQKRIATVLSAIDAKIDLNNRINVELEALAKTIYDYWFVQFDFPDANGRPYKSSGGKMVWNEGLKRAIPVGWGDSNISAVAEIAGGATPSKSKSAYWGGDIPFFTPTDANGAVFQLHTEDSITQSGLDGCSSELFEKGTIFITARGSVGRLAIAGCAMAMNQSCYALKPDMVSNYPFVFLHAKTLIHHLKVKASGSTFNSIVTNDIEWTRLVNPESDIVRAFCKVVGPMFERIESALRENRELANLRDWLLPLLMNGQVRVGA